MTFKIVGSVLAFVVLPSQLYWMMILRSCLAFAVPFCWLISFAHLLNLRVICFECLFAFRGEHVDSVLNREGNLGPRPVPLTASRSGFQPSAYSLLGFVGLLSFIYKLAASELFCWCPTKFASEGVAPARPATHTHLSFWWRKHADSETAPLPRHLENYLGSAWQCSREKWGI